MATLKAQVLGLQGLSELLDKAQDAADPSRAMDEAGSMLLNRIRTRFLAQTDPDGIPWQPSRASQRRLSSGRGGGTLFDSGTLFHSIQLFNRGIGVRAIATDVPYAKKHQEGLDGEVKRVFLGFGVEDVNVAEKIILKNINKALN